MKGQSGEKKGIVQFLKYNAVGILNTAVDFFAYQLLTYLGLNYVPAQCVSYSLGVLNSYFFNSRWTFRERARRRGGEFLRFAAVNLVSLGASVQLLMLCYDVLGIESNLTSKLIVTPVVMVINFLGTKLLVFKK